MVGLPSDVRRDALQNLVAGKKRAPLRGIHAKMTRRVAARPDQLQIPQRGWDSLAALQGHVRLQRPEALADLGERRFDARRQLRWRASGNKRVIGPFRAVAGCDFRKLADIV